MGVLSRLIRRLQYVRRNARAKAEGWTGYGQKRYAQQLGYQTPGVYLNRNRRQATDIPREAFTDRRTEFQDQVDEALDVADLFDKPDINDYIYDFDPEWYDAWDIAPVETMTEGQIGAFIDMVIGWHWDEFTWADLLEEMMADFWEWFRENYNDK